MIGVYFILPHHIYNLQVHRIELDINAIIVVLRWDYDVLYLLPYCTRQSELILSNKILVRRRFS